MSSEGLREIEAAKQRLASAKRWHASAEDAERAAKQNGEEAAREVDDARKALTDAEKRWEVIDVDSVECDGPSGSKRRRLESGDRCDKPFASPNGAAEQNVGRRRTRGFFVYEITADEGICVRSSPTLSDDGAKTNIEFKQKDLVCVDLIRPPMRQDSTNGPYLRCIDESGWIFEKKYGVEVAKLIPVEMGLWAFYVESRGTTLRCHPYPGKRLCVGSFAKLRPMQLIYCDRRVVSPHYPRIASYRVQGTDGWVLEKDEHGAVILLPEDTVKVPREGEFFAHEVVSEDIALCKGPAARTDVRLPVVFHKGDAVESDRVYTAPYVPYNPLTTTMNLRLSDGWGWLFERTMNNSQRTLRQLPIEKGTWILKVINSAGIFMRRHPTDRMDVRTSILFQAGEHVQCNMRVKPSTGPATFYRAAGRDGWVFDRRDSCTMMEVISSKQSSSTEVGWSIGFVRGLAMAFQLAPAVADAANGIISFKTVSNIISINVYYTERSIRIDVDQTQWWQRDCSDDKLRDIMQNPGRYTINDDTDQERNSRKRIVELEKELEKEAVAIRESLDSIEALRAEAAAKMEQKTEARAKELNDQMQREKEAAEQREREAEQRRDEEMRLEKEATEQREMEEEQRRNETAQRAARTCHICNRLFKNSHAKDQHFRAVHRRRR